MICLSVESMHKSEYIFQVVLYTDALDIEQFSSFIDRLTSRIYADKVLFR